MAIKSAVRKTLWARSGNLCALCGKELVKEQYGTTTITGEECHIVSHKEKGPRHRAMRDFDCIGNLILLCQEHHKMIDDNPEKFTEKILKEIKSVHEEQIRKKTIDGSSSNIILTRVDSVRELMRFLSGAEQYATDYPLDQEEDYALFATFLDLVTNFDMIEDKYDEFTLIEMMHPIFKELIDKGYIVACSREEQYGAYKLSTVFVFIMTPDKFKES